MNTSRYLERYALRVVIACIVCTIWLLARDADAQKRIVFPEDTARAGAQICWSETGTPRELWECAAIIETLRNRAEHRGQPLRQVMRAHSDNVFNRARTDGRRWLAWLGDGKPEHWQRHLPWRKYGRWWRTLVRHVRYVLRHDVKVCDGGPTTWGNAEDRARWLRENPGGREVSCGETRNHFMELEAG